MRSNKMQVYYGKIYSQSRNYSLSEFITNENIYFVYDKNKVLTLRGRFDRIQLARFVTAQV